MHLAVPGASERKGKRSRAAAPDSSLRERPLQIAAQEGQGHAVYEEVGKARFLHELAL